MKFKDLEPDLNIKLEDGKDDIKVTLKDLIELFKEYRKKFGTLPLKKVTLIKEILQEVISTNTQ